MTKVKVSLVGILGMLLVFASGCDVVAGLFALLIQSTICGVQVSVDGTYAGTTQPVDSAAEGAMKQLLCQLILSSFSAGQHTVMATLPTSSVALASGEPLPAQARSASYQGYFTPGYIAEMNLALPKQVSLQGTNYGEANHVKITLRMVELDEGGNPILTDLDLTPIPTNTLIPTNTPPPQLIPTLTPTSIPNVVATPIITPTPRATPTKMPIIEVPTAEPTRIPTPTVFPLPIIPAPTVSPTATPTPVWHYITEPDPTMVPYAPTGCGPETQSSVPPHAFIGKVIIEGSGPPPDGTIIRATATNAHETLACAEVHDGKYTLLVPAPSQGAFVHFWLGSTHTALGSPWHKGDAEVLNLVFPPR